MGQGGGLLNGIPRIRSTLEEVADSDVIVHVIDGAHPDPAAAPAQPVLIATGSRDAILEGSKALAAACPQGRFIEIPDRHHFNAPGSRDFRAAAREFLAG